MRAPVQVAIKVASRLPQRRGRRAQVLGYHHVCANQPQDTVSPRHFQAQMAVLASTRAERPVLSLPTLLDWLNEAPDSSGEAVAITFDDGHISFAEQAVAVLAEHRLPALMYIDTAAIGTPGRLTARQITTLAGPLVQFGAHTRRHLDLRRCSSTELEQEVHGSRCDLEDLLGAPVRHFAYPYGLYDQRCVAAVRQAGFDSATTTRRSWVRPVTPALEIPRNFISDYGASTFRAGIAGGLNWFDRLDPSRPPRPVETAGTR